MELYYFERRIFFNTLKACCVRPLKREWFFAERYYLAFSNSLPHLGQVNDGNSTKPVEKLVFHHVFVTSVSS